MNSTPLRIGYITLTDSLPLLVAQQRGLFAAEGLTVELSREASWANVRDKLIVGHLDAAQLLSPLLFAASVGAGGLRKPMVTAFSLGLNGNGLTVSRELFAQLQESACPTLGASEAWVAAAALREVIVQRRANGLDPLVFASVFPYSCHHYQLRHWMSAAGIDTDTDIKHVALPPNQMVDNLRLRHIDGFCVGEPWNSAAFTQGIGYCLVSGYQIWQNAPEKVLGVTADWAEAHPDQHRALLRALYAAAAWIETQRDEALQLLANDIGTLVPPDWLRASLLDGLPVGLAQSHAGLEHWHVFHRFQANFPWLCHAEFLIAQMQRWGHLGADLDSRALARRVYRPDIYRKALQGMAPLPTADHKGVDQHDAPWRTDDGIELGPDRLLHA